MGLKEVLLGALAVGGAVVLSAAGKQAADEFKAWTPWMTRRLTALAVGRLPARMQERLAEEWAAHVAETPGEVGKIVGALGFVFAALRIRHVPRLMHARDLLRPLRRESSLLRAMLMAMVNSGITTSADGKKIELDPTQIERQVGFRRRVALRAAAWVDWWRDDDVNRVTTERGKMMALVLLELRPDARSDVSAQEFEVAFEEALIEWRKQSKL